MKLSVEIAEIRQKFGDFKAVEMIKEAGYDAIDYSFFGVEDTDVLGDGYREYAIKLREHIDKVGITCNQAHAPFRLSRFEKMDITELHYREIVRAIESASILGAENIVVHHVYVPVGETVDGITYEEYNRRFYKSLEPYCEEFGIKIAVENMFYVDTKRQRRRGMLHTMESLGNMVKSINSKYFVACLDIGHIAITTEREPENFIESMDSSIIKTLHVHDNEYVFDDHQLPYTRSINWENVMIALKKAKYSGDLTFEICSFLNSFPPELSLDALKFSVAVGRHLISVFNSMKD